MKRGACILSAVATLGACAPNPKVAVPRSALYRTADAVGCYRVSVGEWTVTGQPRGLIPPPEFRLDTTPNRSVLTTATGRFWRAETIRRRGPTLPPGASEVPGLWFVSPGDTLHIRWNTGFESGGYTLVKRGDSVFGIAGTFSDQRTGHPDPTAAVIGAHVACDNKPGSQTDE